jgi:hypothetical protein
MSDIGANAFVHLKVNAQPDLLLNWDVAYAEFATTLAGEVRIALFDENGRQWGR